ncbi:MULTISPECIES: FAD-dependent oxidoreductase [Sulfurimonas]|uniref:malate dehydrogenase (quinone) n=1 Tax=Sulfurimonas diazotrophicus TaxID=3131939 RepID=A0ABZ3H6T9_9BACT
MNPSTYDVLIVGGGISGAALLYALERYSDLGSLCLLEKYSALATLNSSATSNSQTLHCGDIETNYTLEKAAKVKRTAKMVEKYCLQHGYENDIILAHQKMALGVGYDEVNFMTKRHEEFSNLYPYLRIYDRDTLKRIEPAVVYDADGMERPEPIVGVGVQGEYTTVDFKRLSDSFVENAMRGKQIHTDVFFNQHVMQIEKRGELFEVRSGGGTYYARFVVVDAGAHSLFLAHRMGYGLDFGILPMAGSFYRSTRHILNGKVYMVQNPKLPFAALHGDPDLLLGGLTRFGPTALMLPKLERYKRGTYIDFLRTLRFDHNIASIFYDLLKDRDIRNYVLRNFLFEVPWLNKRLFVRDARKIVPSLQLSDIEYAAGFGGVRPQVLDKKQRKLLLGEASIDTGEGIVFNMTPSPGATSCLGNARRDVETVCAYLGRRFDHARFDAELTEGDRP